MSILRELGLVGTIPVNIERLIKGQGIKLNTNAKPEDFTPNKEKIWKKVQEKQNKKEISMKLKNQNRDVLNELITRIPVDIEGLIKSVGIELNKNAKPEDLERNPKDLKKEIKKEV